MDFFTIFPIGRPLAAPFSHPRVITDSKANSAVEDPLQTWIDNKASDPNAMNRYRQLQRTLSQKVDFDDLRVRDVAERKLIQHYMWTEAQVVKALEATQVSQAPS